METKKILPIIITMVVTGFIMYILYWQQGGPCPCDCDKMQQRIDQFEKVIGDKGVGMHNIDSIIAERERIIDKLVEAQQSP